MCCFAVPAANELCSLPAPERLPESFESPLEVKKGRYRCHSSFPANGPQLVERMYLIRSELPHTRYYEELKEEAAIDSEQTYRMSLLVVLHEQESLIP